MFIESRAFGLNRGVINTSRYLQDQMITGGRKFIDYLIRSAYVPCLETSPLPRVPRTGSTTQSTETVDISVRCTFLPYDPVFSKL